MKEEDEVGDKEGKDTVEEQRERRQGGRRAGRR